MTSEVAVLTKQAVALAADSAVTTAGLKIFNTVNKLFALSKHQPVGIMVYSSAEVMGVPVETAIKEFRRIRKQQKCDHLEGYAECFEEFLRTNDSVFSDEARRLSLVTLGRECIRRLTEGTFEKLRQLSAWGHPSEAEAQAALLEVLAEYEQGVSGSPVIADVALPEVRDSIANAINPELGPVLERLSELFSINAETKGRVRNLVLDHFLHDVQFGGETGFAITGFGTKDVFPRLRNFEFSCSALGVHKVRQRASVDISDEVLGHIEPFAQTDVMATFVEGMDPVYRGVLASFLGAFFEEKGNQFQNTNQPEAAAVAHSIGEELRQKLEEKLGTIRREMFISPLLSVVASMPKEELALLAEALVNLTALKRRASQDAETVGGPTDVAVISKGDGFIWIKRKHYFDAKFNPAFSARYLEGSDEA